jgi:RimJ/RimL family protein N-acetyltransferase
MSEIPVLRTERLILREHRASDFDAYAALWSNEDVIRYIRGRPLDRQESWGRILRSRGMWALLGFGFWVVEERATGQLVGEAGLMDIQRSIEPSLAGTLEAGWAFLPSAQGRGLAGETMRAVLDWGDSHYPATPQSCIVAEANGRSRKFAKKLGFRESGRGDYAGALVVHFRREPSVA